MPDNRLLLIPFHGNDLTAVEIDGQLHVALKPICEAIGIDWSSQRKRIERDPVLSTCVVVTTMQVPGELQNRPVTTLPISHLNGFLFGITASRTKPEVMPALIAYQRECYRVLHDYWIKGGTTNPRAARALSHDRGAAQDRIIRLIDKLRATREPEARRIVHTVIEQVCEDLAIDPPAVDAIGSAAPSADDLAQRLFAGLVRLDDLGVKWDHSCDPGFIAFRLKDVQALLREHAAPLLIDRAMREALTLSRDPEYFGQKTVRSAILERGVHCWVFRRLAPWASLPASH